MKTRAAGYSRRTVELLPETALLSFAEAGKLLVITRQAIEQAVKSGRLPAVTVGPRRFVEKGAVLSYGHTRQKRGWPKGKPRKPAKE